MKYKHSHHAGNFADVVKHVVVLEIIQGLTRKPTPFCYLETHAGRGRYELSADNPNADTEFHAGFGRLQGQSVVSPPLVNYIDLVQRLGSDSTAPGKLLAYPGSPLIAAAVMRPEDRAVLFELSIAEAGILRQTMRGFRNVHIHNGDGYAGLRGQLPPRERRGLVLIDPAFELQEQEFALVLQALQSAYERWPTGIYAIWYPIKQRAPVERWHADLERTGIRKILNAELCIFPDDSRVSLNGCGMTIINPPWQLDSTLEACLPELHRLLGGMQGTSAGVRWIVPE